MISQHSWQAPAINRKKVGDMTVTMLSDGYLDVSFELLSGIDGSRAEELLQKRGASALPRININVYVIQTRERTILVDSGAGGINGWSGWLQVALAAAAVRGRLLDRAASDNQAVSGMHFNLPTIGKVVRDSSSFTLNYDLWSPAV
ncbi:hypothetical protein HAY23_003968 [Salmonella enterica]|uniref:MBL fold metallo-hydrolase n=3 Tax=Salmonella enterica TaxID=28901 RepID=A0A3V4IV62_SALER|nr:hypothetical protein ELZ76_18345 [Salmonella enterica subsp. salamae serovar 42:r:-]EAA7842612.1 hypothetical protein [Salmonella enterica]ECC3555214.1 hypothetical protein [Salmonella enterica subsp. salamae]HCM1853021.1 hypothetical protein [Salmonella enterica subsp. salamae serovar 42:z29:-]AZT51940.1 hypothetical protein EL003_18300 [Salmonella enterica subsp. salamae serovar 42:r:-]